MLGDVEETIYIVSDDEDDDTVKVCTVLKPSFERAEGKGEADVG